MTPHANTCTLFLVLFVHGSKVSNYLIAQDSEERENKKRKLMVEIMTEKQDNKGKVYTAEQQSRCKFILREKFNNKSFQKQKNLIATDAIQQD